VVKRSELLQCSDDLSNKVSNFIRRLIDNMKLLFIYFLGSIFYQFIYGCIPVIYVFVLFMYSYCMFMYLQRASWHYSATLTEVFQCFSLSR